MNRLISLIFSSLLSLSLSALTVQEGMWKLEIADNNGEATIFKNDILLLSKTSAVFKMDNRDYPVTTALHFEEAQINDNYSDLFGSGKRIDLIYTSQSPKLKAIHSYYIYTGRDYILTELKIESTDVIASNYMSPLTTTTLSSFLPASNGKNATLIVPYDNDAWVRYASTVFRANATGTSYEVGCLYNTGTHNGLVVGSIEHDNWKTGVVSKINHPNELISLTVYGGISDNHQGATPTTRDQLPHGKVRGTTIKSPKVMLGFFDDWRTGMETYGDLNAIVAPKRSWDKGTPFGWNSWGNSQTNVSYTIATGVSAFFADHLAPEFTNDSTTYIGLDSYWDRLTAQNRRRFINDCKNRGQKAGIYWSPFVDWNGATNREVEGTNGKYTYGDIHLKINGKSAEFPGGEKGWAIDPTHPGAKMRMDYYIDQWIRDGYEFLKIDFMTHGTFEADSWYNTVVTTGIQAYNEGMKYLSDKIGGKMYINLSISPLFPAQYAHGRRSACDTYGSMTETQYALNALTHSWWTDRIYCYNDPDYMVFGQFRGDGAYPSGKTYSLWAQGENRARYTSVVTTGLCLLGDDFVNSSEEARTRAKAMVKNVEINRIAKVGKSFRPVVSAVWNSNQTDLYMNWVADTLYLAAYHFTSSPTQKTMEVDYSDMGLSLGKSYVVHELWSNQKSQTDVNAAALTLKIPRMDARIYKIYVDNGASTPENSVSESGVKVYPNPCQERLFIDKGENKEECNNYDLYSIAGQKVLSLSNFMGSEIDVASLDSGSYILVSQNTVTKIKAIAPFVKQ